MTKSDRVKLLIATLMFRAKDAFIGGTAMAATPPAAPGKIYEYKVKTIDGKEKSMGEYKGQALLIVNVASLCGFTPQYEGLEALQKKYGAKGFKVLGFPANEFGKQEPGSDAEIKQFCRTKFGVDFDLFSKIVVKGDGQHPLYKFLTTESGHNGDITWNFEKFLVGKDGKILARFSPDDAPESKTVVSAIEKAL